MRVTSVGWRYGAILAMTSPVSWRDRRNWPELARRSAISPTSALGQCNTDIYCEKYCEQADDEGSLNSFIIMHQALKKFVSFGGLEFGFKRRKYWVEIAEAPTAGFDCYQKPSGFFFNGDMACCCIHIVSLFCINNPLNCFKKYLFSVAWW